LRAFCAVSHRSQDTAEHPPASAALPAATQTHLVAGDDSCQKIGKKRILHEPSPDLQKENQLMGLAFFSCIHDEDRGVHGIEASEIVF